MAAASISCTPSRNCWFYCPREVSLSVAFSKTGEHGNGRAYGRFLRTLAPVGGAPRERGNGRACGRFLCTLAPVGRSGERGNGRACWRFLCTLAPVGRSKGTPQRAGLLAVLRTLAPVERSGEHRNGRFLSSIVSEPSPILIPPLLNLSRLYQPPSPMAI